MASDERTVAFLDIMGFRQKVLSTSGAKILRDYERIVDTTNALLMPLPIKSNNRLFHDHPKNEKLCNYYIFSDSLIFYSMDNTYTSCLKLLVFVWRLSQYLLASKYPVRGGISFGEFYTNPNKGILLGKALIDSYDLERMQNWIGIALDEKIIDAFDELRQMFGDPKNYLSHFFPIYPVPMKNQRSKECRVINWRKNIIIEKGTKKIFAETKDKDILEKIDNTLAFSKQMKISFDTDDKSLPVELKIIYIGSSTPPFQHGDEY